MTKSLSSFEMRVAKRPRLGKLIVPYMVVDDLTHIDFKLLDKKHLDRCAQEKLCGVCGYPIRPGKDRFVFLGPARPHLLCFSDPWMHTDCAEYTTENCPFVSGKRRVHREGSVPSIEGEWWMIISRSGKTHVDFGTWHFQPDDIKERIFFDA